jgi:hypothetical protein
MNNIPEELIRPSREYSTGGRWSGSEGRHRKHYVAMIPASRYNQPDDDEVRYSNNNIRAFKHGFYKPEPQKGGNMTDAETLVAINLFLAGQLHAIVMHGSNENPREIKLLAKQIDPDILQGFLDSKPEGFVYTEIVQQAIRLARTFKSLSKG